jgi:hypothetical protein
VVIMVMVARVGRVAIIVVTVMVAVWQQDWEERW